MPPAFFGIAVLEDTMCSQQSAHEVRSIPSRPTRQPADRSTDPPGPGALHTLRKRCRLPVEGHQGETPPRPQTTSESAEQPARLGCRARPHGAGSVHQEHEADGQTTMGHTATGQGHQQGTRRPGTCRRPCFGPDQQGSQWGRTSDRSQIERHGFTRPDPAPRLAAHQDTRRAQTSIPPHDRQTEFPMGPLDLGERHPGKQDADGPPRMQRPNTDHIATGRNELDHAWVGCLRQPGPVSILPTSHTRIHHPTGGPPALAFHLQTTHHGTHRQGEPIPVFPGFPPALEDDFLLHGHDETARLHADPVGRHPDPSLAAAVVHHPFRAPAPRRSTGSNRTRKPQHAHNDQKGTNQPRPPGPHRETN